MISSEGKWDWLINSEEIKGVQIKDCQLYINGSKIGYHTLPQSLQKGFRKRAQYGTNKKLCNLYGPNWRGRLSHFAIKHLTGYRDKFILHNICAALRVAHANKDYSKHSIIKLVNILSKYDLEYLSNLQCVFLSGAKSFTDIKRSLEQAYTKPVVRYLLSAPRYKAEYLSRLLGRSYIRNVFDIAAIRSAKSELFQKNYLLLYLNARRLLSFKGWTAKQIIDVITSEHRYELRIICGYRQRNWSYNRVMRAFENMPTTFVSGYGSFNLETNPLEFSLDGVEFRLLNTSESIVDEGIKMSHCVGIYSRLEKTANLDYTFWHLTDEDGNNATLQTSFELDRVVVRQCYSKSNKDPSEKISIAVKKFIDMFNQTRGNGKLPKPSEYLPSQNNKETQC